MTVESKLLNSPRGCAASLENLAGKIRVNAEGVEDSGQILKADVKKDIFPYSETARLAIAQELTDLHDFLDGVADEVRNGAERIMRLIEEDRHD